ncbi:DUF4326 domain-containing protein [Micromonospora purpureochromogenes]|uniref:DUF4326 domain-containing protein n=1 Tax=Micromonospora purpureochromogenes TaxID=47872 RepID=UPI00332B6CAB
MQSGPPAGWPGADRPDYRSPGRSEEPSHAGNHSRQPEGPPRRPGVRRRGLRRARHVSRRLAATPLPVVQPVPPRPGRHPGRGRREVPRVPARHSELLALLPDLRGRRLGCWCAPERCHAEVIAELADSPPASSLR